VNSTYYLTLNDQELLLIVTDYIWLCLHVFLIF